MPRIIPISSDMTTVTNDVNAEIGSPGLPGMEHQVTRFCGDLWNSLKSDLISRTFSWMATTLPTVP